MARTVISPGGETVELVGDEQFLRRYNLAPRTLNDMWANRVPLLSTLWVSPAFVDKTGRATFKVAEAIAALTDVRPNPLSLNALMNKGGPISQCVDRTIRGKRCFEIRLVRLPQSWYDRLERANLKPTAAPKPSRALDGVPEPSPVDAAEAGADAETGVYGRPVVVDETERVELRLGADGAAQTTTESPLPPKWEPAPMELQISQVVAMQLLTAVVEIVSSGKAPDHAPRIAQLEADLREVEQRLGAQYDETKRLRRKLGEAADVISAKQVEVDGLRRRLRIAEHNLGVAGSADVNRLVTEQVREELAKIMRSAPGDVHARNGQR